MSPAPVYLIRHAQAEHTAVADPPLSGVGRSQASALGTRLARLGAGRILHSPRRRAEQTARVLARSLSDVAVHRFEELDDRTPVPSPDRRADYPAEYRDWLAATPANEQDVDGALITRAAAQLADAARAGEGDRPIIAVTHAFVIAWIVRAALGAPTAAWLGLTPANASLTVLDVSRDDVRLVAFNDTGHLDLGDL